MGEKWGNLLREAFIVLTQKALLLVCLAFLNYQADKRRKLSRGVGLKKLIEIARSGLFLLLLLTSFSFGSYLAYTDKSAASVAAAYGFSAFSAVLFLLSRFKRFSAFGVEAELWDEKQQQAEKLIDATKRALAEISNQALQLSIRAGRWDAAMPHKATMSLFESNSKLMLEAGFTLTELKELRRPFFQFVLGDLIRPALGEFNALTDSKATELYQEINMRHPSPIKVTPEYEKDVQKWRDIKSSLIDWSELSEIGGIDLVVDTTIENIQGSKHLNETERRQFEDKYKRHFQEIAQIRRSGDFYDKEIWLKLDEKTD